VKSLVQIEGVWGNGGTAPLILYPLDGREWRASRFGLSPSK